MYTTLLVQTENGICTVTINRPEKLNALNKAVFDDLDTIVDDIQHNPDIKSVIITGAGTKAFVAGADITEFNGFTKEQAKALAKRGQDIFFKIETSSKPIVAAVNGFALVWLRTGDGLSFSCSIRQCKVWPAGSQFRFDPRLWRHTTFSTVSGKR